MLKEPVCSFQLERVVLRNQNSFLSVKKLNGKAEKTKTGLKN